MIFCLIHNAVLYAPSCFESLRVEILSFSCVRWQVVNNRRLMVFWGEQIECLILMNLGGDIDYTL
jgi:hypothetical protein